MTTLEERLKLARDTWALNKEKYNQARREKTRRTRLEIYRQQVATPDETAILKLQKRWHRPARGRMESKREKQEFVASLKRQPCLDCGHCFHPAVMEFDHRDPTVKRFSLSRAKDYRIEEIEAEIAKCDLVCANCHRVRTARRRSGLPATLPEPEYFI